LIEEASLIATYVTMGLTPIVYNILTARRALKKRKKGEVREEVNEEPARNHEEVSPKDFTLTIPCSITFTHSDTYGHAVHLSIRSIHPLPASHVRKLFKQS